ncbi:MAG: DoxX family protein [Alphaproteobacteria bacterium]|nr:DoxX family protein [Alphaproteobacteria bacterium]MDP6516227.1 DoxX family protein [Alphaproteobacteria bacterium]
MKLIIPPLGRVYDTLSDYSYPLIRFVAGAMLVPHGWMKLFGGRLSGTAEFMATVGLEPAMSLAVYIALLELVGGTLLAVGLLTRLVAVQVVGFMAVSAFYVHWGDGFFWNNHGFEYPLFWGVVALAIAVRGGDRLSIDRLIGKEF